MTEFALTALLCLAVLLPMAWSAMPAGRGGALHVGLAGAMILGGWAGMQAGRLPLTPAQAAVCAVAVSGCVGALYALAAGSLAALRHTDRSVSGAVINLVFALPALLMGGVNGGGTAQETLLRQTLTVRWQEMEISLLLPVGLLLAAAVAALLYATKWGIGVRAGGENPDAAAEAGLGRYASQAKGWLLAGLTAGIGGFSWHLNGPAGGFALSAAGMALLALAAVRGGGYRPVRTLLWAAALSLLRALSACAGQLSWVSGLQWPEEIWLLLPYAAALLLMLVHGEEKSPAQRSVREF